MVDTILMGGGMDIQLTFFDEASQLDYVNVVHKHENNSASQANLVQNYYHFTGQVAVVWTLLQKQKLLTAATAMNKHNIGHLARRIGDIRAALKKAGAPLEVISEVYNSRGSVKYYLKHKPLEHGTEEPTAAAQV